MNNRWIFLIIFFVIGFALYGTSLGHDFTSWDDPEHLLDNASVRYLTWEGVNNIFHSTVLSTYIPLTILSHAIEYKFFHYSPWIYHFNNVLLHILVSFFIYVLGGTIGLKKRAAWFGALLFLIHPMHVESVAWVTERKDVLYSLFYVGALLSYWRYLENKKLKFFVLCVFFGVCSMLSKAMALSLPFVLCILDWLYGRRWTWRVLGEKAIHCLYIVPIAYKTFALNKYVLAPSHSTLDAFLVACWSFTFYIQKFFLPFNLLPVYPVSEPLSLTNSTYFIPVIIVLGLIGITVAFRREKWFLFAVLYYVASIFFMVRFDIMIDTSMVADRFMYLPSLGFCLWLGYVSDCGLNRVIKQVDRRRIMISVLTVVILSLSVMSFYQTKIWKDGVTLWTYLIRKAPNFDYAYNNRGADYKAKKMYKEAMDDFEQAIRLNPKSDMAYNNRGSVYEAQGKLELALNDYNHALEINAKNSKGYNNRGNIYYQKGNLQLAAQDFNEAIKLKPEYEKAILNRGNVYIRQQKYQLALRDLDCVIKRNPLLSETYSNRGSLYFMIKKYDLALKDYRRAIKLKPQTPVYHFNMGLVFMAQNDLSNARKSFQEAKKLGYNINPSLWQKASKK